MNCETEEIRSRLLALEDAGYRSFQCGLMPTVDPNRVIGVRMPLLRQLAGEISRSPKREQFLKDLPHRYYEEDNLHGLVICRIRDYSQTVAELERFLPQVDNWATCDLLRPAAFRQHPQPLPEQICSWLGASHPYTVRFGLGMLLKFYLDEAFEPRYLEWAARVDSREYYVQMMVAWYFATALAKVYQEALPYLEVGRLEPWVRRKAIQKALESRRIPPAHKEHLRKLREEE